MSVTVDLQRDDIFLVNFEVTSLDDSRLIPEEEVGGNFGSVPDWLKVYLRKSFIDKESLNPFGMLRKRVRDYLAVSALNTSIGWIINPADAVPTAVFMDEIAAEYEDVKRAFIAAYPEKCAKVIDGLREEISKNPQWQHLEAAVVSAVERHRPTVEDLEWKLRFRRYIYPVPTGGEWDPSKDQLVAQGILSLRAGLFGELVADLAYSASSLLSNCKKRFKGLQASERRIRFQTRRAAERPLAKLERLSFLDKRAVQLKDLLEKALSTLPLGDLTGPAVDDFIAVLTAMGNQHHLVACIERGLPLIAIKAEPPTLPTQVQVSPALPAEAATVAVPTTATQKESQDGLFGLNF